MAQPSFNIIRGLIFLASVLYVLACSSPVLETTNPDGYIEENISGIEALFIGAITLLSPSPVWLANPLLFVAILLHFFKRHSDFRTTATLSMVCALFVFQLYSPIPQHNTDLHRPDFDSYLLGGAWLWLSSIAIVWIASLIPIPENTDKSVSFDS